jgi:hypothetical protein
VQPLCSLCLCGELLLELVNHRDTENTEVAQRSLVRLSLDLYDAALQRNGDGVCAIVGGKFSENDLHVSLHGLF